MKIYLVGGAVRDRLLGLEIRERDWVVVGATPEEMVRQGFRPVGRGFPVFLHPQTGEEYALARTERKTAPGYRGFTFHASPDVTLAEDLNRRDLTINAIAEDADGTLIDLHGGREDLQLGRLRHISPAFAEDPVRILRCARFAARFAPWGFRVAHGTQRLMRDMVAAGEVDALVPERVWKEFERALGERVPERFVEVLHHCGALARLAPALDRLLGDRRPAHGDPETTPALLALHRAVQHAATGPVRFAALVHAAGDADDIETLCRELHAPNAYRELAVLSAARLTDCREATTPDTLLRLFEVSDALRRPARFDALLQVCESTHAPCPTEYIRQALDAARGVDAGALAAEGLRGREIATALHKRRLAALAALPPNPKK